MKQLRNNAFDEVIKHLKGLPSIEWGDKYNEVTESYRDNVERTIDNKYIFSFDYDITEHDEVVISSIEIHNNNKGFDYETTDEQWSELHKEITTLFNFEK
mgnify:CR=1 FL=1